MAFEASTSREQAALSARSQGEAPDRLDPIKPLLAGAHARGMADALELAGVAAVMIDAHGMVLHAGERARALFGQDLRVDFDHLVAANGETTCAIQSMIMDALRQGELPQPLRLARAEGAPLVLRAARVPGAAGNAFQMLKLLILIEEASLSGTRN